MRRRDCATSRSVDRDNVDEHKATSRVVWTIAAYIDQQKKIFLKGGVSRCGNIQSEQEVQENEHWKTTEKKQKSRQ